MKISPHVAAFGRTVASRLKPLRRLVVFERAVIDYLHLAELRQMPRLKRLFHKATKRHLAMIALGVALMLLGAALSSNYSMVESAGIPHFVWEAMSCFIHALGTLPIFRHVEPLVEIMSSK